MDLFPVSIPSSVSLYIVICYAAKNVQKISNCGVFLYDVVVAVAYFFFFTTEKNLVANLLDSMLMLADLY